ncbi:endonuclease domain-containing protein [Actinoplanes couchii]|uniref:DUF559 domain-containing protein n=1 Tax=Actinoplanes couchii TaxID=403638 RepID=A0ABQ3X179_9ACTN|nr:DUF559 domain-containing protein [Actinoplanes couchii]MDR6316676.1 very-short-patch-repair endonuclease [Actinoplanes couchii]GID52285.1 hypothetical protein Aco03nite_006890 [Actinoplanes couchii]
MTRAWIDLPLDRPISVVGAGANDVLIRAESAPPGAPAVVSPAADLTQRPAALVTGLLSGLDRIARELFPAWLPAAEPIEDATGAGIVAVRSIAQRTARETGQYGPFLADLAERALRLRSSWTDDAAVRFDRGTRARGLARVIAASYRRAATVLLLPVPGPPAEVPEQQLMTAAHWLTDNGFGVWLTGTPLAERHRFGPVPPGPPPPGPEPAPALVPACSPGYPPIPGRPHPASRAERMLEAGLAGRDWAAGRAWNQHHQVHTLANPVRLDLLWRPERLIVEIDGDEHRGAARFAADRQRDVLLQLSGYAVLRFTNDQVIDHRDLVLSQIRTFLAGRRAGPHERIPHD